MTGDERGPHPSLDDIIAEAEAWSAIDIDHATGYELRRLIAQARNGDDAAAAELRSAFSGRLAFGTAGLRGRMGPGPRRFNRVVVTQTSAGFAAFLRDRAEQGLTDSPPSVVIGYDGRKGSAVFARDAAEVMAGAGLRAYLLPEPGPTPLTSFAVRYLDAAAGVMITASHNPPGDNGYKVYLGDADGGAQIAPPMDREIAAHIDRAAEGTLASIPRSTDFTLLGPGVTNAYVAETASALLAGFADDPDRPGRALGSDIDLTVCYTAMHGVGSRIARRVFTASGLPTLTPVREQDVPDGSFPSLEYPNPEEPGSLDIAYRRAREIDADIVVAHDPDADRLALALPSTMTRTGYRRLTGNELGLLLGMRAAEREHARAAYENRAPHGTLACTIVSSPALREVAREYGLGYEETLSGFKWVSRVPDLLFGYEEALGYLTHPEVVRDKDGISAAADAVAMVRELRAQGRTVWDLLDDASERFGHFASSQVVLRRASMEETAAIAAKIRATPPERFGTIGVRRAQDLLVPGVAAVPANVLRYDLEDGSRVMVRPSGTEPKLKIYLDTMSRTGSARDRRRRAEQALRVLGGSVRSYLDRLGPDTP